MLKQEISTMTIKTLINQFLIFFLKQQDPTKGIIDFEFVYSGDYVYHFDWLIDGFKHNQTF